jgi:Zn-dependent protease with chaperone function
MARSDETTRARLDFLEWEARTHPRRHQVRLLALALLGYLYPVALLSCTLGVTVVLLAVAPFVWDAANDAGAVVYALALAGSLLLAAAVARTFSVPLPEPHWQRLAPGDAPALRDMLDGVCRSVGAPPVHHIYVSTELNAAVAQRPRYGFWGPRTNHVIVGLPLLAVMTPGQVRVTLAHECGHLVGRHNSFTSRRGNNSRRRLPRSGGCARW